jgi:hypothetical protein
MLKKGHVRFSTEITICVIKKLIIYKKWENSVSKISSSQLLLLSLSLFHNKKKQKINHNRPCQAQQAYVKIDMHIISRNHQKLFLFFCTQTTWLILEKRKKDHIV